MLPEKVQFVTLSTPLSELKIAPPVFALLPRKVELATVRFPLFCTPPPLPVVAALEIVRLFSVSTPEFTKMLFAPPPSMTIVWPVPSISTVFTIEGSVLATAIVPLTVKAIVSLPVPGAQSPPVVSDFALALLIASRRLHAPSLATLESSSVLTVMVLAPLA